MATIDTTATYTLSNSYTGEGRLLAINPTDNTTPHLLAPSSLTSPPTHAQWFLTVSDIAPFYHLHTLAGGPSRFLDVKDSSMGLLRLTEPDTQLAPGQFWRFDIWEDASVGDNGGEGVNYIYRLSNNLTGLDRHLDVYGDTLGPHLANGGRYATGQYWRLGKVGSGGNSNGTRIPIPTGSGNGTTEGSGKGVGMGPAAATTKDVLSVGAIAGIAIGSVAVLVLAAALAAFLVLRKKNKTQQNRPGSSSGDSFVQLLECGDEEEKVAVERPPVELSAVQLFPRELPAVHVVRELPDRPYHLE